MLNQISAIFNSRIEAEQVVSALRNIGVPDSHLSIITRHADDNPAIDTTTPVVNNDATGKGLLAGAGLGALFGLASAFIPGVGPFIAAGALATTLGTVGASAVAGAAVGAATGAMGGVLTNVGYPEQESRFYGNEIERGGVLVATNMDGLMVTETQVRAVYQQYAGRSAPVLV